MKVLQSVLPTQDRLRAKDFLKMRSGTLFRRLLRRGLELNGRLHPKEVTMQLRAVITAISSAGKTTTGKVTSGMIPAMYATLRHGRLTALRVCRIRYGTTTVSWEHIRRPGTKRQEIGCRSTMNQSTAKISETAASFAIRTGTAGTVQNVFWIRASIR